jgi:topoisomerase-4 subunit A
LNADKRGKYLGEFTGEDKILVIFKSGEYQLYNYDLSNHFESNILHIEKFDPGKILSVVYYDADQEFYYVKRFEIEETMNKTIGFIGENKENKLVSVTWVRYPRLEIEFGGKNRDRENEIIEVAEFIGIKSWKAKGKRLSNYQVENIKELEPVIKDEHEPPPVEEAIPETPEPGYDDIPFEIQRPKDEDANQMTLF